MSNARKTIDILITVALVASLVVVGWVQRNDSQTQPLYSKPIPIAAMPSPTNIPQPRVRTFEMESPEGSRLLTLERVESSGLPLHSVFVHTKLDQTERRIMSSSTLYENLSIPFNTWSPDTVYFFLQNSTPQQNDFLVFQSSGEPFSNDERALSVQQLFRGNVEGYIIEDVTGWASENLLLVNTKEADGDEKVSFWFEVPSQTFIQLGTYFK